MIYLDNAATMEPIHLLSYFRDQMETERYGNPSSIYSLSDQPREDIAQARESIAQLIGCSSDEIYFTSGGTEADNWALKGIAEAYSNKGKHIITSKIEHHAVLYSCKWLEKWGYEVTYLDVDEEGFISLKQLERSIRSDTILVSIMFANNEIGTIQPIKEIGEICKKHNVLFHTDAVQAVGHVPINVEEMNVDLLSASAHKFRGPKGVGFLYVRRGTHIVPFMHGGGQENGLRAGTENVEGIYHAGIAATYRSFSDVLNEIGEECVKDIRDYLIDRVLKEIPYSRLNGSRTERLPGNASFSFKYINGESLLLLLDQEGIYVSTGAACNSDTVEPSHVLKAIGLSDEWALGTIRMTVSEYILTEDIDKVIEVLKKSIQQLRDMSEEYKQVTSQQDNM